MKVDKLETHDRLEVFQNQADNISQCCQSLIDQRPFGDVPFYIFAHQRTLAIDERYQYLIDGYVSALEDVPTHKMIWQPRLTKPKAQTNSMLFKAYPGSDQIKIIWILPVRELWDQYGKDKLTESNIVAQSIYDFEHNRKRLERKEEDDLSDEEIDRIYREISAKARKQSAVLKR